MLTVNGEEVTQSTELMCNKRAKQVIKNHGFQWSEFADEVGYKDQYTVKSVFNWLEY